MALSRYRPEEMLQKCVLFHWEKRNVPQCVKNESTRRLKYVKNARNTFHLLDDTDLALASLQILAPNGPEDNPQMFLHDIAATPIAAMHIAAISCIATDFPFCRVIAVIAPPVFQHRNLEFLTCEPAHPLQRSLGPFGAKVPKKSRNCLLGPPAPEPQNVSGTVRKDSFDTLWRLSGGFPDCSPDFLETFRGCGAGDPGIHFRDFFGISGPKSLRDLCKGGGLVAILDITCIAFGICCHFLSTTVVSSTKSDNAIMSFILEDGHRQRNRRDVGH